MPLPEVNVRLLPVITAAPFISIEAASFPKAFVVISPFKLIVAPVRITSFISVSTLSAVIVPVPALTVKSVESPLAVPSILGRITFAFVTDIVRSAASARTIVSSTPLPSLKVTAPAAVSVGSVPVKVNAPAPPLLVTVKAPPKL